MTRLAPGTLFAGHRIDAEAGRGGMGVVYRATQLALERPVALKVIAAEFLDDAGARERFVREARLAAAIDHAHVLPLYYAGEEDGVAYIAMRYVDGDDLRTLVRREGPLRPTRAARIVAQVASALDAAHAAGLVHRDVKPANVLLDASDHAYLGDFGLTKYVRSASDVTRPGGAIGSADYMSPEQIRGEPVDRRTDVYALGCLLFFTLTGRVPFPRESDQARLWAHLSEPRPPVTALRPRLPASLDVVIARALAKNADERHRSAGTLARDALAATQGATRVPDAVDRTGIAASEPSLSRAPDAARTLTAGRHGSVGPAHRYGEERHSARLGRGPPPLPNPTIGRAGEIGVVTRLLTSETVRLLTVTGPGGVGKTRLAGEAARLAEATFEDGVAFVPLGALGDAAGIASAIASSVDLTALAGETAEETVTRVASAKQMLLVLDNVEHLLPAAALLVARLLEACPQLVVLATSREALEVSGENRYPLAPLSVPEANACGDPENLSRTEAVALFCRRAEAVDPRFRLDHASAAGVVAVCRRLDGLPLALELAAARTTMASPAEIAQRLDRLGSGPRDAPARQQTLEATIDWSYDLLPADEQACFAALSVCAGGATLDAAERITGQTMAIMERLVAKSLVVAEHRAGVPSRLSMLETIRAYAKARLDAAADLEVVHERHCLCYLDLLRRHGSERAMGGVRRAENFALLAAEGDNFDVALAWATGRGRGDLALGLVVSLQGFWYERAHLAQSVAWVDRALTTADAAQHDALRVRALLLKSGCLWALGHGAEHHAAAVEAETLARRLDDPLLISRALQRKMYDAWLSGRDEAARELADEALACAKRTEDAWEVATACETRAMTARTLEELKKLVDEAVARCEDLGRVAHLAPLLNSAAYVALLQRGDLEAKAYLERARSFINDIGSAYQTMLIEGNAGLAALFSGDPEAATTSFREELKLCREMVVPQNAEEGLNGLAAVEVIRGNDQRAARLAGAASAQRSGRVDDAVHIRLSEEFYRRSRARLGSEAWNAAFADGATVGFTDAVSYALGD